MYRGSKRKCLHCRTSFRPDHRNRDRQRYCHEPACRKASKAASQQRWLAKPDNCGYFRGPIHVRRVQVWRAENPGYWRKKDALQDSCNSQHLENKNENRTINARNSQHSQPLQDPLLTQHPLIIGLLATFTGHALQDDIASTVSRLIQSGLDILSGQFDSNGGNRHAQQADHPP